MTSVIASEVVYKHVGWGQGWGGGGVGRHLIWPV